MQPIPPRVGMLATDRNRRGLVTAVEPSDGGPDGTFHLVSVEYIDADGVPEDHLLWETEKQLGATTLEPSALPNLTGDVRPRHVAWAELLRRTFGLDVLACPDCAGGCAWWRPSPTRA